MRYLRLYMNFLRFSFSRAMEFRVDFFFRVVMDTFYYVVTIGFYAIIYKHTALLGGWNLDQTLIFIAGYFVVDALHMTFSANNLWILPYLVNKGDLDYYLVRPVSSLFFLSLRDFAANSSVNLICTFGILAWALGRYDQPLAVADISLFILLIINGAFLYYLMHMLFIIPVFWTHSGRGFGDLFMKLHVFGERPDRIFQGWFRKVLVSVLPFALMASFPARILFEGWQWSVIIHIAVVTIGLFAGIVWLWNFALRNYSSASS